ncbi:ABC-2 type transport system ATP-binding protein [Actinomadura meyerae]|jgi:ABC-2 type transport system ATP-binding protein|uniref:ABC-2 type transport system ATP-binding protein n=1 Tax=Actinomadura meyerae TaxID=240840 RepID=A0A239CK26_9ACTN|nr:ABC transporter ATP-binding protein [Actinomadura meyerae]SNS19713.1 ABC-2 type transport system ATP-binding protein [Actinomadura meyerae]
MNDPAITVTGLRQRYGDFEAVAGISFEVGEGELFALLGTNGAGKTTTLETLEGHRPAHAGTVRVLGHDPYRERRAVRPRMGIMLQDGGFFADLTVAETVEHWRGFTPAARGAEEAIAVAGLAGKAGVRVRQLSGGQKRRLDLALALLGRPQVIFLDEPTTGMDPEARQATWTTVRGLVADGTTVLLTTHYLEEAEHLADRLAIMHRGRIETSGTVGEVVAGHGDRIRFRVPGTVQVAELPELRGARASISVDGGRAVASYAVTGAGLQACLYDLLRWADGRRLTLDGLEARSASLEDVFLRTAEGAAR